MVVNRVFYITVVMVVALIVAGALAFYSAGSMLSGQWSEPGAVLADDKWFPDGTDL